MLDRIADKARNGKRLDRDEGRFLLAEAGLLELGALAQEVRFARVPDKRVTFVIDSNPNYTNVCITDCQFCAFYRKPGDPEAWTLTVDEVLAKIEFAASKGPYRFSTISTSSRRRAGGFLRSPHTSSPRRRSRRWPW